MKLKNGLSILALAGMTLSSYGLDVTSTTDTSALADALDPQGVTINSVSFVNGGAGQFGIYSNFNVGPVTIADGIVLSSGEASLVGGPADPELAFPEPSYATFWPGTMEFDAYGPGRIENFFESADVAALEISFHLTTNSQVKFDFIFGSVEYPYWTSDYTDAMLVFLDGTDPTNQIVFDDNMQPVQVGISFAGLVSTNDQNTAFGYPHGVLGRLTTTTAMLGAGDHTLRFEVGDVNDEALDSAAFIANLRAEAGDEGTELSLKPPPLKVANLLRVSGTNRITLTWTNNGAPVVLEGADSLIGSWNEVPTPWDTNSDWILTTVTNDAPVQFFRLRRE